MTEREQRVRIRPVKRDIPDLRRLARALIELATEEKEPATGQDAA